MKKLERNSPAEAEFASARRGRPPVPEPKNSCFYPI
jgi:hypothetical protein